MSQDLFLERGYIMDLLKLLTRIYNAVKKANIKNKCVDVYYHLSDKCVVEPFATYMVKYGFQNYELSFLESDGYFPMMLVKFIRKG